MFQEAIEAFARLDLRADCGRTYEQVQMRLLLSRHAFRVTIVLHRCLYKILVDR